MGKSMELKPVTQYIDKGIPSTLYKVSDTGKVWSTESEQWLAITTRKDGYQEVDLKNEGIRIKAKIHRLVAYEFFGPPPPEKTDVDHLNMDRQNNTVQNLEYVTHEENMRRRNASGSDPGGKDKKPVVIINDESQQATLYLSHKDAIEALNISAPTFYKRLTNCDTIYGNTIYPVVNPEVINERDKRKQERESDPEPAETVGQDPQGLRPEEEEYLSKTAKTVLDKWSKR